MEKTLLSLKTLYKLLTADDFPSYAESVFGVTHRKGMTLGRFWMSAVSEELRNTTRGKLIWKNDGKRSRYFSQLINRSEELPFYREYVRELSAKIDETALELQIHRFQTVLRERSCRYEALHHRIAEILPLWEKTDPHVTGSMIDLFRDINNADAEMKRYGEEGELFQASYLLSVLTLYSLAGDRMDDPVMKILEENRFSLKKCWERLRNTASPRKETVYLTRYNVNLQKDVLPAIRFFGREEELYDLREIVMTGRKCLLTGIGGIGKTETMRQLLRVFDSENVVDRIAVVPYGDDLVESFASAFPGFPVKEPEEGFREVLYNIEKESQEGKRVFLFIDDLTNDEKKDPYLKKLKDLSASVIITSRRDSLEGFETYRLNSPSVTSGTLIFRDNYSRPMEKEDVRHLQDTMKNEVLCHPLTLRLLAATISGSDQPLRMIDKFLGGLEEGNPSGSLKKMYDRLYSRSRIPEAGQKVISLMTLLPYEQYAVSSLKEIFPDVFSENEGKESRLQSLIHGGWLSGSMDGISMHPLIAECLRKRIRTEDRLKEYLDALSSKLPDADNISPADYQDSTMQSLVRLFLYMCDKVTGPLSKELVRRIFAALDLPYPSQASAQRYAKLIDRMRKRCSDWGAEEELRRLSFLAKWSMINSTELRDFLRKPEEDYEAFSRIYADALLYAANYLIQHQEPNTAKDILNRLLETELTPFQRTTALWYLFSAYQVESDYDSSVKAIEEALDYAKAHPEVGQELFLEILASHGQMCLSYGKAEETKAVVAELEKSMSSVNTPSVLLMYGQLKGMTETYFGDPEKGLEYLEEHCERMERYGGKDRNYFAVRISIATVLLRLKKYDESVKCFEEAYQYAVNEKDDGMIHLCGNNLAVAYLEMNNAKNALKYLEPSVRIARGFGGLGLGEALKNMARAYGQLHEYEIEKKCLEEAVPILIESYGEDNERAAAAANRLAELKEGSGTR